MTQDDAAPPANAKTLYEKMSQDRDGALSRARMASKLTLPTLVPPEGHNQSDDLPTPYQSVGGQGVNNLASKLLLTIFPTSQPMFRQRIDDKLREQLEADKDFKRQVTKALATYEQVVMRDVDEKGDRTVAFEALKHLIVAGNVAVFDDPEVGLKIFHLSKYVVRRDPVGRVVVAVVKEEFDPMFLPKNVREAFGEAGVPPESAGQGTNSSTAVNRPVVDVYTVIMRSEDEQRYEVWQEISTGQRIADSYSDLPAKKLNWDFLRMIRVDGEDYGRSYVEEYLGDLQSLDGLMEAIVLGSAAAAKVLFLVKPNATLKPKTLAKAPNGFIGEGSADDVTVVQLSKFNDFRVAQEVVGVLTDRLQRAFLMNSAVQRDAERVTAEEVRFVAEELEQGLGGVFSLLTQEWSLPFVRRRIANLVNKGKLPKLPEGATRPVVIVGLEALGRGMDRERILRWMASVSQTLGPDALRRNANERVILEKLAIAEGVDFDDLLKTPDEIAQEAQRNQMMMLAQKGLPNAINQVGKATMQDAAAAQQQPQQPQGEPVNA